MSGREDPIYLQAHTGDDGVIELRDQHGRPVQGVADLKLHVEAYEASKAWCEVVLHSKDGSHLTDGRVNDGAEV